MQNLPNELVDEISKSLTLQGLKSLASTCKNYNDLLDKDIKDLSAIERALNNYYIRVMVSGYWCLIYKFYI
jgi:hypothetical protein